MRSHNRRIGACLLHAILIALVSSCTFRIERLDLPIATTTASPTLPVLTSTRAPAPAPENTATPTARAAAELSLAECIPVAETLPDDLDLSGIWVRNSARPYLETMDGRTAYGVPLQGGGLFSTGRGDMAVSPDGKYLAYIDPYLDETGKSTRSRALRIINSSGRSLPMDYWIIDWQWLIGWTDNQHLAIFTGSREILSLEPFTGRWEKLETPGWMSRLVYDAYGNDGPFYSPSLRHLLIKPDYSTFELKAFQTGEIIYAGQGDPHSWELDWSADGSRLAVTLGKSLQILTGREPAIELDASRLGIETFDTPKLSPDGQKLVFTSKWSGRLFLLDLERSELRKLCSDEFDYWVPAVWSPQGRFVVQEADSTFFDPLDLLIDTEQLRAYKLPSGKYHHRLVWLAEP